MGTAPSVLVFDVNETLIDIDSLALLFEQIFGDPRAVREWFGQLVLYSMTTTMSGCYVDFFTLGQGLLKMLADIHHVDITGEDVRRVKEGMLTMPAHPDVADGLTTLRDNGFRLVTLTNSPPNPDGPSPLEHAGLGHLFERQFSVDKHRAFKPAPLVYRSVCEELDGGAGGVHDGRRTRVGHHRRSGHRLQRGPDHPAGQRTVADSRTTATEHRRRRSARSRPSTG